MGFLSSIMAPIGRPQAPPPARDIRGPFGGLFNSMQRPLIGERNPRNALPPVVGGPALPPVDPRIIPTRPPSIGGIGGINQDFRPVQPVLQQPLQKMPLPPKRDDFMSIGGPGGGFTDNRTFSPVDRTNILPPLDSIQPPPLPEERYGTGKMFDPANLPEGYSFQDTSGMMRTAVMPPPGFVYAYGPDGDRISVPSGEPGAEELRNQPPLSSILGNLGTRQPELGDGMTEPSLIGQEIKPTDMGVTPTGIQNPPGTVDPVLQGQQTAELITDPLVRALYFGTADQPGFYNQLQQAGANLIGSDVPLQQTAGLTPLELLARQQAVAGIGGFEPFLQQNRELVNQAIEQSRRAEGLQDPYYTQAEQIYQDTMGAYDPSMTQQFYNPFEDAVVQQTVSDVLEAGEQQDIAARAREIGAGAFGGSRARLGAMERREALGEGLAQALGKIRQQGFSEAQRTGLSEFARQQEAKRTGAQGLIGIGRGRGSAASDLATQLAGFGGQMTGIGQTQEQLRAGQRGELAGFGATGRGIAETGLSRLFQQQMDQQMRPLGVISQIGSLLPGYKQASTQIDSTYGMPKDPTAEGLGAAFSAYAAVAPKGG